MTDAQSPQNAVPPRQEPDSRLATRRQSLLTIGRFAAATAPAMLVLLNHGSAAAKEDSSEKGVGSGNDDKGYNEHTGKHSHA